jgi:hypothetical protein
VIYRCEGDICPDPMTEILVHDIIKILSIADGDLLRNSVTIDDVLLEKFPDGSTGYVCYWFHFNTFGEVLDCDNGEGVVSLCWCNFFLDIDAPPLQGP